MIKIALLFLAIAVNAVHIDHQQTAAKYNSTNYLSELEARQNKFKADILVIRSQIDEINRVLNTSALTSTQKLTTLNEGMADQRDTLYNIQTYLNMPFQIEPCQPCNLTAQQKIQLQQKIDSVNASLQNLQGQVNFCLQCPQIQMIKQQLRKQFNYLRIVQATLNSGCLQRPYQFIQEYPGGLVNLADSTYKDNLKATNWIYGNITQQQYKQLMFPLTTQYNLTSCPLITPYFDPYFKKCVICRGIYSIGERKCLPCPDGKHYNSTVKNCVDNPTSCPAGSIMNTTTKICDNIVCAQGTKLDPNTNQCISICASNQIYNTTSKSCQGPQTINCTVGQFFNTSSNKCEQIVCPSGQIFNSDLNRCVDPVTASSCPPNLPFWNATAMKCQLCPDTHPLYNKTYNRCEACPFGQVWNSFKKQCEPSCGAGQIYNDTLKACQSKCALGQIYNFTSGQCYNQCTQAQVYNPTTKQCDSRCKINFQWDQSQQKCVCMLGYILNGTECVPAISMCKVNYRWDDNLKKCVCSPGYILVATDCVIKVNCSQPTPVWNSMINTCQSCPVSAPWFHNGACKSCPQQMPNYSPLIRQCVPPCPKGYIWNTTAYRCDMIVCGNDKPLLNFTTGLCSACPNGFTWVASQRTCKSIINSQCPNADKPFYNPDTKVCQLCPPMTVFNRVSGLCQYCPAGFHLDPTQTSCIAFQTCATNPSLCPVCPQGYQYNQVTGQCEAKACPPGYHFDQVSLNCVPDQTCDTNPSLCVCPAGYQYNPISKMCESRSCPQGYVFNSTSGMCQKCQDGYYFNSTILKCVKVTCVGGYLNPSTQRCQQCPLGTYADSSGSSCISCPVGTFYVQNQGCVRCPDGSFFDVQTSTCHKCQDGSVYNTTTRQCQLIACQSGTYYSLKQKNCKPLPNCPSGQYFSLSTQICTAYPICGPNQTLNMETKQCQSLSNCPSGYIYNKNTNLCDRVNYVTGTNATNLIYAYNFTQYVRQYQAKKASDPSTRDCPYNTPYYDRNAKVCVACSSDRPYFNLHTSLCQNCGSSTYDSTSRMCKTGSASVDPTLERLIMNI